ncbi:MAG: hypothetical protein R3Y35_02435 [Clostridia bacterium]
MVKKAVQSLWKYKCDVVIFDNEIGETGTFITPNERVIYKDLPCHLRYFYYNTNSSSETSSKANQVVRLFVDSEVVIPAGSKVYVSKGDFYQEYQYSGLVMEYDYHSEYGLAIVDRRI